jgi:NADH-quinone oxidoreductase subunit H
MIASTALLAQAVPQGDPLYQNGVGLAVVLITILKVVVCFAFLLIATMFMVWFERKVIAGMQNRIGPNRAGPWGILQTLADGIKAFFKEPILPERVDRFVYRMAPYLAFVPAFLMFTVVPIGGDFSDSHDGVVTIFGHQTFLQVADPPAGILFVLALSSIAVYGIMLAGWSSGSKYPLLGSVRATAQMVSYEAALGLSVAAVILVAGTLSTHGIVLGQDTMRNWNVVTTGFLPFIVFVIAATAELNRPPFDLVEAEQELVGGFHTEYSSIGFALFYLAEFMNTVTMSAIIVTLFLGGPQPVAGINIPLLPGWLDGIVWFFLKLFIFLFMYVWFRATLPRFRYDQLMDLGWKVMIPVAFGWFLFLTTLRVTTDLGWTKPGRLGAGIAAVAVACAAYGLFMAALRVSARQRELRGTPF